MASPAARPRLHRDAARRTVNARLEKPAVSRAGVAPGPNSVPVIAVTTGEPAGIGPDVCLALARKRFAGRIVVLGDREMLESRARQLRLRVKLRDPGAGLTPDSIACLHIPLAYPCRAGTPDPRNAPYVISLIDRAIAGCKAGEFAALTTAPVHKGVINDGGIPFIGHTEYLAERTGAAQVVMVLAGGGLRVALATTHLALKDVPRAIAYLRCITIRACPCSSTRASAKESTSRSACPWCALRSTTAPRSSLRAPVGQNLTASSRRSKQRSRWRKLRCGRPARQ